MSTVQAGVMVWKISSWHTLGLLIPLTHRLSATDYLSIVTDHVFMATIYLSSNGDFQYDNAPWQKGSQTGFHKHDNEASVLHRLENM